MGIIQRRNDAIENSRHTNQSGPLRLIVDSQPTGWGHGHFEILECGHRGQARNSIDYVQSAIKDGKQRRCPSCGKSK